MSEAELHVLRSRLRGGVISKARRGELAAPLPVGFCYDPAGKVATTPTPRSERSSATSSPPTPAHRLGARHYGRPSAAEELSLPVAASHGTRKVELNWVPLAWWAVELLHNPRYAWRASGARNANAASPQTDPPARSRPVTSGWP